MTINLSRIKFRTIPSRSDKTFSEIEEGGQLVPGIVGIYSKVMFSSLSLANNGSDVIDIQDSNLDVVQGLYIKKVGGIWKWQDYYLGSSFGAVSFNTWYTVTISLKMNGINLTSTITIDGVDSGNGEYTIIPNFTQTFSYATIGQRFPRESIEEIIYADNVGISQNGSLVLSTGFETTIIPPFTDVFPSPEADPGVSRAANPSGTGFVLKTHKPSGFTSNFAYLQLN